MPFSSYVLTQSYQCPTDRLTDGERHQSIQCQYNSIWLFRPRMFLWGLSLFWPMGYCLHYCPGKPL